MAAGTEDDRSKLGWLLIATVLHFIVVTAQRPVMSLYLTQQGVTVGSVGLITSAYGAAALLVAYPAGSWTDRFGLRRMVQCGSLILGLGTILVPLVPVNALWFSAIQVLLGVGSMMALIALQAGSTAGSTPQNRDRAVAMYMVFSSAGQSLGPILGGFGYDFLGPAAVFWGLALLLLTTLFLPVPRGSRRRVGSETTDQESILPMLRVPRFRVALITGILVLSTMDTITTFFPIYGEAIGLSATGIGLILGVRGAASMMVRPLQPWIVQRLTRHGTMLWVLGTSAVTTCLLVVTSSFPILLVLGALVGASLGLGQPLSMTEVVDSTPEPLRGRALGVRLAGHRSAQMIGPLVYGVLAHLGTAIIFVGSGLLLALGALIARRRPGRMSSNAPL